MGLRANRVEEEATLGKQRTGEVVKWAQFMYPACAGNYKEDEEEMKSQQIIQCLPENQPLEGQVPLSSYSHNMFPHQPERWSISAQSLQSLVSSGIVNHAAKTYRSLFGFRSSSALAAH